MTPGNVVRLLLLVRVTRALVVAVAFRRHDDFVDGEQVRWHTSASESLIRGRSAPVDVAHHPVPGFESPWRCDSLQD